jgi:signal transduction histidine kinase
MPGPRRSIRTRLALVYSGIFFSTSALLMAVTYLIVRRTLADQFRQLNTADLIGKKGELLPPGKVVFTEADGTPVTLADLKFRITADQQHALDVTTTNLVAAMVIALTIAFLLSLLIGWLVSGRAIRPLLTVIEAAEMIADSNLHRRIQLSGPNDELKRLADTFDAMLERLDRSFDAQRRFIGNASHELRTPLAVTRTLVQVALRRPAASPDLKSLCAKLLDINIRQTRLTDSLLILARADHQQLEFQRVDLGAAARDVFAKVADRAQQAGIRVRHEIDQGHILGDSLLITHLIQNLVNNALIYNYANGEVDLVLRQIGPHCQLTITNTGPTVPQASIGALFEPFNRLGSARAQDTGKDQGSGLGLSIVRSIVDSHNGALVAHPRPGGGLVIEVTFDAVTHRSDGAFAVRPGQGESD